MKERIAAIDESKVEPLIAEGMWRLIVGSTSNQDPFLKSLNNFAGRLTWEFDSSNSNVEEQRVIEQARQSFTGNRHEMQHSADVLYRTQFGGSQSTKRRKTGSVKLLPI